MISEHLLLTIAHESEENSRGHFGGGDMASIRTKDFRVPLTSSDPLSCPKAQIIIVPGSWKKRVIHSSFFDAFE